MATLDRVTKRQMKHRMTARRPSRDSVPPSPSLSLVHSRWCAQYLLHLRSVLYIRAGALSTSLIYIRSGCRESDPDYKTPSLAYYHYTTARLFSTTNIFYNKKRWKYPEWVRDEGLPSYYKITQNPPFCTEDLTVEYQRNATFRISRPCAYIACRLWRARRQSPPIGDWDISASSSSDCICLLIFWVQWREPMSCRTFYTFLAYD